MNLESDKRLNIQLSLDFSSAPTGEARQAGGEDIRVRFVPTTELTSQLHHLVVATKPRQRRSHIRRLYPCQRL